MHTDNKQFLRDRITALRLEKNLSEYQLSLELGKCKTYIQSITSGKSLPSMDAFFDLCDLFELEPAEFFARHEKDSAQLRRLTHQLRELSSDDLDMIDALVERLSQKEGR